MSTELPFQKLAFLDTNVLHYVSLYLDYAKGAKLFPWTSDHDDAAKHLLQLSNVSNTRDSMRIGLETLKYAAENRLDLKYSEMARLELVTGRVRGKGLLSAASEGLPDRMWSRFDEEEIRWRVSAEEMKSTADGVERIGQILQQFDFAERTTNRQQMPDVLELAYAIASRIYMDVADSIVFASTILSGADYLFTSDNPFKKTVNRIQDPGCSSDQTLFRRFRAIRKSLDPLVAGLPGTSDDSSWPTAHSVTANGTWNPPLA